MAGGDAGHHEDGDGHGRSHFLVVASGFQGHLNPARALARRLALAHGGAAATAARVTLSVPAPAHGRMFPSLASPGDEEASDGLISYAPHSNGFGFGFGARPRNDDERARSRAESAASLSALVGRLAAAGRPVTCVVSTISLPAVDVAARHGIPLAVYWAQSAATLAAYYHYYHGYERLVAARAADPAHEVSLPGLPPLRIGDFPSFLVETKPSEVSNASVEWLRALFVHIGREKPTVLVNTIDVLELEAAALQAMKQHLDVIAVGPMVAPRRQQADATEDRIHLYKQDEKDYMEWLDAQPERSVVYVSYGSMLSYSLQQVEEMLQGLRECGRPYLWVVREDGREEEVERCIVENNGGCSKQGMILEWCDQIRVLSHSSVGCFVTHCGWNSTLEAVTLGVPVVAVPNLSDQPLNAHLMEEWGVGVRAERNGAGLLVGAELARCIGIVVGDDDGAMAIRENASALKDRVRKEAIDSGVVELRLQNFIASYKA